MPLLGERSSAIQRRPRPSHSPVDQFPNGTESRNGVVSKWVVGLLLPL